MKNMIYSVRIIRRIDQCVLSIYLEEFFKLCGIYVCDYIADEGDPSDIQKVSVNLILTDGLPNNCRGKADFEHRFAWQQEDATSVKELARAVLNELFCDLDSRMGQGDILSNTFKILVEAFMNTDYARVNYAARCFRNQMGEKLTETAQAYYNCYQELRKQEKEKKDGESLSPYLQAAKLICAGKVNSICRMRRNMPLFDQGILFEEAEKLAASDGDYSMGNVLAGMLALGRNDLWREGIRHLNEAIDKEGKNAYACFVSYSLGQYYEKQKDDSDAAWKNYERILCASPGYYRAEFKKGCRLLKENDYHGAYDSFDTIIKCMENRREKGWIRPLELEYDYKCHLLNVGIKRIFLADQDGADRLVRNMENLKGTAFMESDFMKEFFCDHLAEYRNYHEIKLSGYGSLL